MSPGTVTCYLRNAAAMIMQCPPKRVNLVETCTQLHQLDLLGTVAKSIAAGAEQKSCRASRWLTGLDLGFVKVQGWSCLWSVGNGAETEDGKALL